ncbi:unnamed protein product [Rhodiola kirilowii]
MEESKLGDFGAGDDIEKLLDSCSEIFDSPSSDLSYAKVPTTSEFKNNLMVGRRQRRRKMGMFGKCRRGRKTSFFRNTSVESLIASSRESIALLFFCWGKLLKFISKVLIASFIKTHIFSRRRPIDGWKYMIEEIGPNAKKGKGSAPRIPTLSDPSTQPFREERPLMDNRRSPPRQR